MVAQKKSGKEGKKNNKILYFVIALLFVAILLAILVGTGVIDCGKKKNDNEESKQGRKQGRAFQRGNPRLKKIAKNSYMLPKEFFGNDIFPNAIMNDRARTVIQRKYLPQMIGVPSTGKPFRLDLPRPISDELIYEIIEAVTKDDPNDMFFVKTMNPPTLIGYKRQISGEMTSYCENNAAECDPVDIYFYQGIYSHDEPNV